MQARDGRGGVGCGAGVTPCCLPPRSMYPCPLTPFGSEYELRSWMGEEAGDFCLSVTPSHAQARKLEVDLGTRKGLSPRLRLQPPPLLLGPSGPGLLGRARG